MGFLDRLLGGGGDADPEAEQRRLQDIARVERGGIPLSAEERIRELAGGDRAFTSGLSINDFALSRLDGVRPICQVMGSSIYKVGWQNFPWGGWNYGAQLTELRALTDAWNHARSLALGRLAQEAQLAGCHAVVDVSFNANRHDFLNDEIEIVVNGTAVHLPDEPSGDDGRAGSAGGGGQPVLTDLSLPEFTLLRRAGYRPMGIVASTSVFYIVASWATRRATMGWQRFQPNQELTDFTQGIYAARETALWRAGAQALDQGAGGLIGVKIEHDIEVREVEQNNSSREDLIVTFHLLGTSIAHSGEHQSIDPKIILRQGAR